MSKIGKSLFLIAVITLSATSNVFAQDNPAPPNMNNWKSVWNIPISISTQCGEQFNVLIRETYIEPTTKRLGIQLITYSQFGGDLDVLPILTAWEANNGTLKTALWLGNSNWQVGDGGYIVEGLCSPSPVDYIKGDVFAGVKLTIFVDGKPYTRTYESRIMK